MATRPPAAKTVQAGKVLWGEGKVDWRAAISVPVLSDCPTQPPLSVVRQEAGANGLKEV